MSADQNVVSFLVMCWNVAAGFITGVVDGGNTDGHIWYVPKKWSQGVWTHFLDPPGLDFMEIAKSDLSEVLASLT